MIVKVRDQSYNTDTDAVVLRIHDKKDIEDLENQLKEIKERLNTPQRLDSIKWFFPPTIVLGYSNELKDDNYWERFIYWGDIYISFSVHCKNRQLQITFMRILYQYLHSIGIHIKCGDVICTPPEEYIKPYELTEKILKYTNVSITDKQVILNNFDNDNKVVIRIYSEFIESDIIFGKLLYQYFKSLNFFTTIKYKFDNDSFLDYKNVPIGKYWATID